MAFYVNERVLMEQVLKNADISILSNILAILFKLFSRYRERLANTTYMPNSRSIGPLKQKLRGGGQNLPSPAIPICKRPTCLGLKDDLYNGLKSRKVP